MNYARDPERVKSEFTAKFAVIGKYSGIINIFYTKQAVSAKASGRDPTGDPRGENRPLSLRYKP